MSDTINLWRYNRITGIWGIARICNTESAAQWLAVFQADEPKEHFKLANRQPKHNPTKA